MKIWLRLKKVVMRWRDARDIDRYERIMCDIDKEADAELKLRKQVLLELHGTLLGGMASSTAYISFRSNFFEKISSQSEKEAVKNSLVSILKSNEYKLADKEIAAYVCADIGIADAIPEIEKLLGMTKKGSYTEQELIRALTALKLGRSISKLIRQNLL